MKINLKKRRSKILEYMAILFLLFVFANVAVGTAQAQETERDYVILWSYKTGDIVEGVSVSSDGSYIAAGSEDGNVYFFNRNGEVLWSHKTGYSAEAVSVSSDGSYIASGSLGDEVYFFNRNGELLWRYKTGGTVYSVSVSSDGSYIAAGASYKDNKVYFFNRNGELLWSYKTGRFAGSGVYVAVSSDGSYIAAGALYVWDDKVYLFNRDGTLLWSYKMDDTVRDVSVSSDGSYIAAGASEGKVYFFNKEGKLLWSYKTGGYYVYSVSVSSDGSYIAAGSRDNKIYLFNRNGELLWSYKTGHWVTGVSVSSDGLYIAAGSRDNKIYFFTTLDIVIEETKRTVESGRAKGFNIAEAETLLSQAEQAFKAGDNTQAKSFADQSKAKALEIDKVASGASSSISNAQTTIPQVKSEGFIVEESESLLSQAESAFNSGDYRRARELADESYALAIDIDIDGVPNEEDFAPTIKNNDIYAGGVVLTAAFIGTGFVFSRNRKKRKEYRAKVREYRAKIEQWKAEGYKVDELEEMLR